MSKLGEARRVYEAALRSAWDEYRHITVKRAGERIVKTSDGAIAAARAGNVTRLVDCLRGRKPLTNDDCIALTAFIAARLPRRRWPKRLSDALRDRTDDDYGVLADFVEKIGRRRGRQRNELVHDTARLAEVLVSTGLAKGDAIELACKIVSKETDKIDDEEKTHDLSMKVHDLLHQAMHRRRRF